MTTDIELALAKGKISGARALLIEELLIQDKQEFEAKLQTEVDSLYKTVEVTVQEELDEYGNVLTEASSYFEYVEGCISFEEYKNETRVVQEAVLFTESNYDSSLYNDIEFWDLDEDVRLELLNTIIVTPEVTELVRPYIANDVTAKVDEYLKFKYAELRAKAYPPIAMFADAWVKNDTEAMEEYRKLCLEVKERFPK